jgi:hypothetical protein
VIGIRLRQPLSDTNKFPFLLARSSNSCMTNRPPISETDKQRLSQLLDDFLKLKPGGAGKSGQEDHDERERLLDEMQQMLGLGMVLERDIVSKAKKALGRT